MKKTPTFAIETDYTGVWTYAVLLSGRLPGWEEEDNSTQHPHKTAALRSIVATLARSGRRAVIIDGERMDGPAIAASDSYLRKYYSAYAAKKA